MVFLGLNSLYSLFFWALEGALLPKRPPLFYLYGEKGAGKVPVLKFRVFTTK